MESFSLRSPGLGESGSRLCPSPNSRMPLRNTFHAKLLDKPLKAGRWEALWVPFSTTLDSHDRDRYLCVGTCCALAGSSTNRAGFLGYTSLGESLHG